MIVHICNNYVSSKVHRELVSSLAGCGVEQEVFIAIRQSGDCGKNEFENEKVSFDYQKYPGFILKYFPVLKVLWIFLLFRRNRGRRTMKRGQDIILAHTLWSDGAVAYINKIIFGTPYVAVVRNTDLNWFIPKLPHYRWLVKRIVSNAESLVFVSSVYKSKLKDNYPSLYSAAASTAVLPNGLDRFWIDNKLSSSTARPPVVFFAGRFDENKNLPAIYGSVQQARNTLPSLELHLAGGTSADFKRLTGLKEIPDWIKVLGKVNDKDKMLDLYRSASVFLMPSFHETFGLVYLEALSQGCPFIFTRGEGMDGLLDVPFAIAVGPDAINEIEAAILALLEKFPRGVGPDNISDCITRFDWGQISKKYLDLLDGNYENNLHTSVL